MRARSLNVTTLLAVALLASHGCARTNAPTPVRVDGSPGVRPLIAALAASFTQTTGVPVAIESGLGSSRRAAAVADSLIDIAMASHGIDTADIARRGLEVHEIARTAVVFAVHEDVPLAGVTSAQVCEIVSGSAVRWSRYNAGALPIVPLLRPPAEVDAEVARAHVPCLRDIAPAAGVRIIERPDSMAATLARTRGAFGVTSLVLVEGSEGRIRALHLDGVAPTADNVRSAKYPLVRSSYLITRRSARPEVARFLEFIRDSAGARLIAANGAVAVVP